MALTVVRSKYQSPTDSATLCEKMEKANKFAVACNDIKTIYDLSKNVYLAMKCRRIWCIPSVLSFRLAVCEA